MKLHNFNAIYSLAQTLYDVALNPILFEDMALNGWERIGNKHTRLHKYISSTIDKRIKLPCNVDLIEYVSINAIDSQATTNLTNFNHIGNAYVERYINMWKNNNNLLTTNDKLAKYRLEDDELVFDNDYSNVTILYHGIIVDDEGLPLLNDKEINALAAFLAYSTTYKEALIRKDGNLFQMANMVKLDWLRFCNSARIPDKFTQNDIDSILDVKTRWDRKMFNKTYKPIL